MNIHCSINKKQDLTLEPGQRAFKVEYIHNGYWAIWYAAGSAKEAKEILKKDRPLAYYLRSKTR